MDDGCAAKNVGRMKVVRGGGFWGQRAAACGGQFTVSAGVRRRAADTGGWWMKGRDWAAKQA